MRRFTFTGALVAALLALVVVAPPVAAETWQLEPPYAYTQTDKVMCCGDGMGVAQATASPDGVITASATYGGSWFESWAEGWVGDSITWTPTSTSGDTSAPGKKKTTTTTTTTTTTDNKALTISATIEITRVALVGSGAYASVGIDGCYNVYNGLAHEDTGKVITITCTRSDMSSGDVVAVGARAQSADRTFGGWAQGGPSTASVEIRVRSISVNG